MTGWSEFLSWIESSALGEALRHSGVWTYGIINLAHILGIATLFGSILVLDLRLLGWRRGGSLEKVAAMTAPLAVVGFCVAVISGICMLSVNGSEYADNPFLPIKFLAITIGAVNTLIVTRLSAWRDRGNREATQREQVHLAAFGGISLLCWLTAIGAGRMIGYW